MLGTAVGDSTGVHDLPVAQTFGIEGTPVEVFSNIFTVFLVLGTLVGVVVIGYTLLNAYKYRDGTKAAEKGDDSKKVVRPEPGQIPTGSGGGKKLFLSFGISAIIVLSLIVWTYAALLTVEAGPPEDEEDSIEVMVVGNQFSWTFIYPNGIVSSNELVVPEDRPVELQVTGGDVFHAIGIREFRTKADAIPGQVTDTYFVPDETGEYQAVCYELCGSGHSGMSSPVNVTTQDRWDSWYESEEPAGESRLEGLIGEFPDTEVSDLNVDREADTDGNETSVEGDPETGGEEATDEDLENDTAGGNDTATQNSLGPAVTRGGPA